MIDVREKLSILYLSGFVFSDYSTELAQFKDEFEQDITLDFDKYLYIGFHKPIKNFYVNIVSSDNIHEQLYFEVYENTFWKTIQVADETFNFDKSGFISLKDTMTKKEINGQDLYWVRISSTNEINIKLSAISMLLCSINDLEAVYPPIAHEDYLLGKKSLHVAMELAKNNIIQELRNKPVILKDKRRLSVFDLLDVQELRQAAAYRTVANVLRNNFNTQDDKFYILAKDFFDKAKELLELYTLTVDYADDSTAVKSSVGNTQVWELKR